MRWCGGAGAAVKGPVQTRCYYQSAVILSLSVYLSVDLCMTTTMTASAAAAATTVNADAASTMYRIRVRCADLSLYCSSSICHTLHTKLHTAPYFLYSPCPAPRLLLHHKPYTCLTVQPRSVYETWILQVLLQDCLDAIGCAIHLCCHCCSSQRIRDREPKNVRCIIRIEILEHIHAGCAPSVY